MIINCINCTKKFKVDSFLIPEGGRTIQCGSCNYVWFYTPKVESLPKLPTTKISEINNDTVQNDEKNSEKIISQSQEEALQSIPIPKDAVNEKDDVDKKLKKKNLINLGKFLSYFLVFLISFVSLIILLDTFKSPLSAVFPNLEVLLYNLFETIKDIYLFSENLFI
jgi:predicted Zn finger-like uncharacterized protein